MRSTVPPPPDGGGGPGEEFWWRPVAESGPPTGPRHRVVKEMERLALLGHERLDELRHKLLGYRAGDLWFPAGGIPKQDTDIPPVITVLLVGFAGVGKSSLVDLMYSVLGRAGFVPFAQASSPAGKDGRTLCLEEHNVLRSMRNGFCVFDSRGLDYDRVADGIEEASDWIENGVRHRQLCRGAESFSAATTSTSSSSPSVPVSVSPSAATKRFVRRRVNCAIVVASLSELYQSLVSGDVRRLNATRDLFHCPSIKASCNENPILVLTHGDELTAEERINGRIRICEFLGISDTGGVYDVPCINEHGALVDEMDPVTAYAVSEAIYRALLVADRGHPPKPSVKDWVLLALTWSMYTLSALFAFLSCCCSKAAKASRDQKLRRQ
ncbi:uncharacterized protein [Typha latifolia]|uniref:uncharacterized protein n=1 Tax=Typha latifolia TaxID=4733 RepID=UPI003C2EA844